MQRIFTFLTWTFITINLGLIGFWSWRAGQEPTPTDLQKDIISTNAERSQVE